MKQIAIDWSVSEISDALEPINPSVLQHFLKPNDIIKAKEMEKKQIIDAWVDGDNSDCLSEQDSSDFAEQYYNKTFNTKNK